MHRILLVEDDTNIRDATLYALRASGFEALGFEDAAAFYGELSRKPENVALVLLDIMLPGEDGLTILRKLRASRQTKDLPVIMLTARGSEFDKVTGLDLGADDYIVKPFSVMEMMSRISAVLRRTGSAAAESAAPATASTSATASTGSPQDSARDKSHGQTLEHKGLSLNDAKRTVSVDGTQVALTFKEYELLRYLLINSGLALSRDRIIEEVWGYDYEGESRTLDMHIKSLRQKLGPAGADITTIRNFGYRLGI